MIANSVLPPPRRSRAQLQRRTEQLGQAIFQQIDRGPTFWDPKWWDDQLMSLTMNDPEVKVQLFRFIDALPALQSHRSIRDHLREYLEEVDGPLPLWLTIPLALVPPGPVGDWLQATATQIGAHHMAHRFIAGETPRQAARQILRLRRQRMAFTADLLGEAVITEAEAESYLETCLEVLRGLEAPIHQASEDPLIDRSSRGPLPRLNLSVKLTSLTARYNPDDPDSTARRVLPRLRQVLREARRLGAFVNFDMEQNAYRELTYSLFKRVLMEPEFRDWPHAGIVVQAYLRSALADLQGLGEFVRRRRTPITIRLVKGAYWDYETLHARQFGWPIPVHQQKYRSDACFERCTEFLIEHERWLHPALGSHNVRSLAYGLALAERSGVAKAGVETQALYGMGEPIAHALVGLGYRSRIYTPYGDLIPGMAYLVRRLLENTSNESFLKQSVRDSADMLDLLRNPEEAATMFRRRSRQRFGHRPPSADSLNLPPFANEPLTDFAETLHRTEMAEALEAVRSQFGQAYPGWIDGQDRTSTQWIESRNPSRTEELVGRVAQLDSQAAEESVVGAKEAFVHWSNVDPSERIQLLLSVAQQMRERRFELAAWIVFESGKPWNEADADVAEAIDFCEFYARGAHALQEPHNRDVPGESNRLIRIPRGVTVVIAPWNFPLAIPCGMVAAALVTGNTVIYKPAEQTSVIARKMVDLFSEAGVPKGVLQLCPGLGEEVGSTLVNDPRIAMIAFTGSRQVGLAINRQAAETPEGQTHVKRVIAEMGGKNALIIDADADLDEAVSGTLQSALGYAGQKCSACSRVIVLDSVYESFCERIAEGLDSIPLGPSEIADTVVGPVIDEEARDRVERYREIAKSEGRTLAEGSLEHLSAQGTYVAPLIIADVDPQARIAQEEVFGPILAVIRARDLDEAIRIANGTDYALTGGIYSRSPANIDRVTREFLVGNFYINRTITGALVDRQPFGGFGLSGIGTKAGGPDYLLEFTLPRTITENTMRRGFASEAELDSAVESEIDLSPQLTSDA